MSQKFIVANPIRGSISLFAQVLLGQNVLKSFLTGDHRRPDGIDKEYVRRLLGYDVAEWATARLTRSAYLQEVTRFSVSPIFDQWVMRHIQSGDHLVGRFGYINRSLKRIKQGGGLVLLEAGNSHPACFYETVGEEYKIWGVDVPPIFPTHHRRQMRSVELVDYVLSPSDFVSNSFVRYGIPAERILQTPYPVDTTLFQMDEQSLPSEEFVVMCSGQVSLRKGSPYLFEAFERFHREVPNSKLFMLNSVADNMKELMRGRFSSMAGVEWFAGVKHALLVKMLQRSSVFVMPSIEEGMVRSAIEAMATGLPIIVTPNTGVNDYVIEGKNGTVVPIRNVDAIVRALHFWHEKWLVDRLAYKYEVVKHTPDLGIASFNNKFSAHLSSVGVLDD